MTSPLTINIHVILINFNLLLFIAVIFILRIETAVPVPITSPRSVPSQPGFHLSLLPLPYIL